MGLASPSSGIRAVGRPRPGGALAFAAYAPLIIADFQKGIYRNGDLIGATPESVGFTSAGAPTYSRAGAAFAGTQMLSIPVSLPGSFIVVCRHVYVAGVSANRNLWKVEGASHYLESYHRLDNGNAELNLFAPGYSGVGVATAATRIAGGYRAGTGLVASFNGAAEQTSVSGVPALSSAILTIAGMVGPGRSGASLTIKSLELYAASMIGAELQVLSN